MDTPLLIQDLNHTFGLELAETATAEALRALLAEKINALIRNDFGALVQLLYRVDVNESKLRRLLEENADEDAGNLIAGLIIERQWQKIETRRQYRRDSDTNAEEAENDVDGEERW
jgi:hypothetical protein